MERTQSIYRVVFNTPPTKGSEHREFYYTSLAAIFDHFTAQQVGCGVKNLYAVGVTKGKPYNGRLCTITKHDIKAKKQNKPLCGLSIDAGDKV